MVALYRHALFSRIQITAYLLFTTSTVSQLAVRSFWKFVHVKSTAVTNFYLNWRTTTIISSIKADFPGDFSIFYGW